MSGHEPMRAVFLDRDDTLIRNVPYLGDPAGVEILPGVAEGLGLLNDAGFRLLVVSNQSGVGRGLITKEQVAAVNLAMESKVGPGLIGGYYLSYADPSDPSAANERKPSPALLFRARDELGLDLGRCFMVGDKRIDIECARNAGCRAVLVRTGTVAFEVEGAEDLADHAADDFLAAAQWILSQTKT
ncbi:MAG: HAD-IIIA family hydrolase [Candidatus Methylacidiphilales bacterium]|nr:HAD-IIIA family hydrolase [Candidatus Methylacidiphilales bacterium]